MDLTTVVGMLIAWILVIGGMATGGSLGAYVDLPSLLITIGGTVGAVIASFPGDKLKAMGGVLKSAFVSKEPNLLGMVQTIVSFAEKARREGLLALEADVSELDNEFMKKSIQLVVDGTDPELVKAILDTEIGVREDRHLSNKAILDSMAELAPAYGMIGTLIGLHDGGGEPDDAPGGASRLTSAKLRTSIQHGHRHADRSGHPCAPAGIQGPAP